MADSRTQKVAELNDLCRTQGIGGLVVQTAGVNALPSSTQAVIHDQVRNFDAFTEDNDPYGEHDFGLFDCQGHRVYWKIDYYAPDLDHGSEDPADPTQTVRVLTIMLASEY